MNKFYTFIAKLISKTFGLFNLKKKLISNINYNLGLNNLLLISKNYNDITKLEQSECKIFSQNGEDGILDYIITVLKIERPNFIEIGVGSYVEANTRFIYDRFSPKGVIIDIEKNLKNKVFSNINPWKGDLRVIEEKVTTENINIILSKNCDFDVDIFSLDIDSTDYWILDKLKSNISKIFVAEYNAVFGSKLEVTTPNMKNFNREEYHYSHLCFGMSLRALINIMVKKNYYFIGTNSVKNNAFFVSNDYPIDQYFKNLKIRDIDYYVDTNIRESRDITRNLNYLSGEKKLREIYDCEVIDLSVDVKKKVKIRDIIINHDIR
ncbi:hypothetical protein N8926_01365 [Candidatus Pelagibacter sp.]|nr:hypothetical protein [Candidatus Pelagibacter sp.]